MDAEILKMARALLDEEAAEETLEILARDVESYILAYCGTEEIPEGCETLAARMIAAAAEGTEGAVKSLSRGDFSVSFSEGEREGFSRFDGRLNAFRKIKWK